jgi:predicted phage tail protein
MNLRTLHLYGELAKTYGKRHRVCAGSFHDAIRVVDCNHPGFLRRVSRGNWHCLRGDKTLKRSFEMYPHHVMIPVGGDLHLLPAVSGGKSQTLKIILTVVIGGALLATGIGGALGAFGAGATGLGLAGTGLSISFGTMALMGAGILLGGLQMLLTPVPKDTSRNGQQQDTWSFDGPQNVSDEGVSVPLVYGELIVGGVTIASDISNGNPATSGSYTYTPGTLPTTGYTTGGGGAAYDHVSYA